MRNFVWLQKLLRGEIPMANEAVPGEQVQLLHDGVAQVP